MKYLAAVFLLAACHHEVKESAHIDDVEQVKTAKTAESTLTKTEKRDATDVDTKTTKSENAVIIQEADGSSAVVVVAKDKPLALAKGARVIGTVPVSKTVVDQNKRIGATETETAAAKKSTESGDAHKSLTATAKNEETEDVGFSWKFYLLAGGILAAVVALGLFLAHSKRIRRLLGEPL